MALPWTRPVALLLAGVVVAAAAPVPACTDHVDPSGCRANSDIVGAEQPMHNLTLAAQITRCSQLCCARADCDAWAVREKYDASWAKNCNGGVDCCLLKKTGWSMAGSIPGCTSGGKETAPPAPPPPAPPPTPGPPPPPLPHGGGSCTTEWDCSLGGECTGGKCVCDPQYTGSHCAVLHLRRAKLDNGMQVNGTHTWGGHALKDAATGKWVGFFSYMAGRCDLGTWGSNSMIVSAVSDAPDGPFSQQPTPVLPPWTHNAMISKHPNGSYFLFHIGGGDPNKKIKPCSSVPDPFFPFPHGVAAPAPSPTHVSESLHGPWRPTNGIPALNNPCPFFFENGTTLLYDRESMVTAPSVDGPWSNHRPTVVTNGSMHPEDPGVYRDKRGHFHMLFNANSGHSNCRAGVPCGGHAWSMDGLSWSLPYWPAFGTITHYQDNTTARWDYVERPQVSQEPDGTPLTFFAGHGYRGIHTLALMFCQEGDADCVTTVQ